MLIKSKDREKKRKRNTLDSINALYNIEKWFIMVLKVKYYPYNQLKVQDVEGC